MTQVVSVIPTQLEELLGFCVDCSCGKRHEVTLQEAWLGRGVLSQQLVPAVRRLGQNLSVRVVVDRRTHDVAGLKVTEWLKKGGFGVTFCIVPDSSHGRPHADEDTLQRVEQALRGVDLAIAVGSGTINDLTKLASYRNQIPYFVVPTAPSMNGYTSSIAAILTKGVKRTIPCRQPLVVLADMDILSQSPAELVAAGVGDLLSKSTATADYKLSNRVRGDHYCSAPEQVVLKAEAEVVACAKELGACEPDALHLLTEALLLSGLSMQLAGSSSPASGAEHLISHHWDMLAPLQGRVEGYHGAQVGVATIVSAALYQALADLDPAQFDVRALVAKRPSRESMRTKIHQVHAQLAQEVELEFLSKWVDDKTYEKQMEFVCSNYRQLFSDLQSKLRPAHEIQKALVAAKAAVTMSAIGLTADHLRHSLQVARHIRGRYTILDLAAELEVLAPLSTRVLAQSGCMG